MIKDHVTFNDCRDCLLDKTERYKTMNQIRSYHHDLYSVELYMIVLSANDEKRYITENGIRRLPWGHYSLFKNAVTTDQLELMMTE